jgi:hypothetical protein
VIGNFLADNAVTTASINSPSYPQNWTDVNIDDVSCIDIDLPADAGPDLTCIPGNSVYIGRPQDFGIDEACTWYQLPGMVPLDTAAGITVWPVGTTTYVVKQDLWCGGIKWDTVVVWADAVGIDKSKELSQNLKVWPVPADEKIFIESSELRDEGSELHTGQIINSLGQVVKEMALSFEDNKAVIDIKELANGIYFLKFPDKFGQSVFKILKE